MQTTRTARRTRRIRNRITGWVGLLLAVAIAMGTLTACREEGPAEKAGKALDEAAADAQDAAEEAKKDLEEALGE